MKLRYWIYLAILAATNRRAATEALLRSVVQGWYGWSTSAERYAHTRRKLGCLISGAPMPVPGR